MRTIIHDLNETIKLNEDDIIVNANDCKNNCIGCFSCWIKHPKKCIYNDNFSNLSEKIKNSDELIIISKSRYGCYSADLKRVLERCIGYVLPYFTIRNNQIHHSSRYDKQIKLTVYFYGEIDKEDENCLYELIKANAINFNTNDYNIKYLTDIGDIYDNIN